MMRKPLKTVHGHSMSQLQEFIKEELGHDIRLVIGTEHLGGWSNINIPITIDSKEYVLKLPWQIANRANPYTAEFNVTEYLSELEISPRPYKTGKLSDRPETPYLIMEYFDGIVYHELSSISKSHVFQLKESLKRLSQTTPPDIESFSTPHSLLDTISARFDYVRELLPSHSQWSADTSAVIDEFLPVIYESTEIERTWHKKTIHGDLQESNVVFTANGAVLLDLESCMIADPLYDRVYLLSQANVVPPELRDNLVGNGVDDTFLDLLSTIALFSVIVWTVNRLHYLEHDRVEPNLTSPWIEKAMREYVDEKLTDLRKTLQL